jgi:hypothetical protein
LVQNELLDEKAIFKHFELETMGKNTILLGSLEKLINMYRTDNFERLENEDESEKIAEDTIVPPITNEKVLHKDI